MPDNEFHLLETDDSAPQFEQPLSQKAQDILDIATPKKRGWPKGKKRGPRPKFDEEGNPIQPRRTTSAVYGTKRDHTEVSKRLQAMLTGATGVVSAIRPSVMMTDEEAENIAEPLTAYLIRQEPFHGQIGEFLDRYDLAAAVIAILAYAVRVWIDDGKYREQQRITSAREIDVNSGNQWSDRPNAKPTQGENQARGSQGENPSVGPENSGNNPWISTPHVAGI